MDEKEFDFDKYEEYRNNIEMAAELHDNFYRIRNMLLYFVLYSVLHTFVIGTWLTNWFAVFVSLVAVYLLAKVVTYLFDELRFAIRTFKNNRRKRKNGQ